MIFCKSFEVTKSYIIILSVDCNTHLHTLIKKNIFFLNAIIFRKNKGGRAGHQVEEKQNFLGRQKFLADGVAGDSQIWPGENN